MKTYNLYVNGQDVTSSRVEYSPVVTDMLLHPRETLKTISALKKGEDIQKERENSILGKYYLADENHIEQAIESASQAFKVFKNIPIKKRLNMLIDINAELKNKREEFIDLLIAEGHPRRLAVWQYENMVNGTLKENDEFYFSLLQRRIKNGNDEEIILTQKPDGVILVVPPRNAPASNSFVSISALINGNVLIIKPPQKLPISTIFLWREIVQKAADKNKLPKGVINIIQGNSSLILDKCLASEKVKTVFIFGESEQGIELGKKVYSHSKKPILELSGNDTMLIWKDVNLSNPLLESSLEAFLGSTQICMVPKIFLIHPAIYEQYVQFLASNIHQVKAGLPNDNATWLSPVGKKKEYFQFLHDATDKGAKIITGGESINLDGESDPNGLFIQPTLLKIDDYHMFMNMQCFQKEIFFPLIPLVKVGDKNLTDNEIADKMIEITDNNKYGLRISIWLKDQNIRDKFINGINNCGSIRFNSRHIGFSKFMSTHGGTGLTGGPQGEMNYMCLRAGHLQGISVRNDD